MAKYGIPYQGSKSAIADEIISALPEGVALYDLFSGGGAMSHAAVKSGKWEKVVMNDVQDLPLLFDEISKNGYSTDWVSSEKFKATQSPYIKYIWSFSNSGKNYMYGQSEKLKNAGHRLVVNRDYSLISPILKNNNMPVKEFIDYILSKKTVRERRLAYQKYMKSIGLDGRLEHLERMERLDSIVGLQGIEPSVRSYHDVEIEPGGVIYCDPPYNTASSKDAYTGSFNHRMFWQWVKNNPNPIYVSEYSGPSWAEVVWSKKKLTLMSGGKKKGGKGRPVRTEKLFWNGKSL